MKDGYCQSGCAQHFTGDTCHGNACHSLYVDAIYIYILCIYIYIYIYIYYIYIYI